MTAIAINGHPENIGGKRLLAALGMAIVASAAIGAVTYLALRFLSPNVRAQVIVFLVYTTLVVTLCSFFKPTGQAPIGLRFTTVKELLISIGLMFATIAVAALFYYLASAVFGSLSGVVRQIAGFATDAKRLQGQPAAAWIIAIPRGLLLVPLFEEVLFRGLLLSWLRKHLRENLAVIAMAALFALEHGLFIVMPYAFMLGIVMGFVKLRTGSTLNTLAMHSLHNLLLLAVGLRIFWQS